MVVFFTLPALMAFIFKRYFRSVEIFPVMLLVLLIWVPLEPELLGLPTLLPKYSLDLPGGQNLNLTYLMGLLNLALTFMLYFPVVSLSEFKVRATDVSRALRLLVLLSLVLIPLGLLVGFIQFHSPHLSLGSSLANLFYIYFLIALPEEFLFRGVLMKTLSKNRRLKLPGAIVLSISVFALSHLNNATTGFATPNWTYVAFAFVAGLFYAFCWKQSRSAAASALLHCGVNFLWLLFF